MRVTAAQTREQRRHEAGESYQWIASERAEQQIEPDNVGLQTAQGLEQAKHAARIIK